MKLRCVIFSLVILCSYLQFGLAEGVQVCNKTLWRVIQNSSNAMGRSRLQLKINRGYENGPYDVVLACGGLIVQGAGIKRVELNKRKVTYVQYGIEIPHGFYKNATRDSAYHSCIFELKKKQLSDSKYKVLSECRLRVKSALVRLVPHCDKISKTLVKHVKVLKARGTANVYFENSANDVVRIGRLCKNTPLHKYIESAGDKNELYGLTPSGTSERIYAVSFYPDCDALNTSLRKELKVQHKPDCYVSVHAVCQEGEIHIKTFHVNLDKESMYCHPPKSIATKLIENIKLKLRVESGPVAALLCLLMFNISLYLLLLPCLVTKCVIDISKIFRSISLKRIHQKMRRMKYKSRKWTRNVDSSEDEDGILFGIPKTKNATDMEFDDGDVFLAYETTTEAQAAPSTPKQAIPRDLITFSDEKDRARRSQEQTGQTGHDLSKESQQLEWEKKMLKMKEESTSKPRKSRKMRKVSRIHRYGPEEESSSRKRYEEGMIGYIMSKYEGPEQEAANANDLDLKHTPSNVESFSREQHRPETARASVEEKNGMDTIKRSILKTTQLQKQSDQSSSDISQSVHFPSTQASQLLSQQEMVPGQNIKSRKVFKNNALVNVKKTGPLLVLHKPSVALEEPGYVSDEEQMDKFVEHVHPQDKRSSTTVELSTGDAPDARRSDAGVLTFELEQSDTNKYSGANEEDPYSTGKPEHEDSDVRVFPLKASNSVKYTLVRRHSTRSDELDDIDVHDLQDRQRSYSGPLSLNNSIESVKARKSTRSSELYMHKRNSSQSRYRSSQDISEVEPRTSDPFVLLSHGSSQNHRRSSREAMLEDRLSQRELDLETSITENQKSSRKRLSQKKSSRKRSDEEPSRRSEEEEPSRRSNEQESSRKRSSQKKSSRKISDEELLRQLEEGEPSRRSNEQESSRKQVKRDSSRRKPRNQESLQRKIDEQLSLQRELDELVELGKSSASKKSSRKERSVHRSHSKRSLSESPTPPMTRRKHSSLSSFPLPTTFLDTASPSSLGATESLLSMKRKSPSSPRRFFFGKK